jgi:hypothetical protein
LMLRMTRCGFSSVRIALRGSGSEERYFLFFASQNVRRRQKERRARSFAAVKRRAIARGFSLRAAKPNAKRQTPNASRRVQSSRSRPFTRCALAVELQQAGPAS